MKRSKFPEERFAYALRHAESGTPVGDVCGQLGVSGARAAQFLMESEARVWPPSAGQRLDRPRFVG